jgi:hypothetical protein
VEELVERLGERMLARLVPRVRANAAADACRWEFMPPCLERLCCDYWDPPCGPWEWGCGGG